MSCPCDLLVAAVSMVGIRDWGDRMDGVPDVSCESCGGSGILQIIVTLDVLTGDEDLTPYATWCNECPTGAAWREAGLGAE